MTVENRPYPEDGSTAWHRSASAESRVIHAVARLLMYEAEPSPKELLSAYLSNGIYLMCTLVPWTEAIRFYPKDILGGAEDREESHNTRSSVLSAYPYEGTCHRGNYQPLSAYDTWLADNPIFPIPAEETRRMKALAQERLNALKQVAHVHPEYISLKLGLDTDEPYRERTGEKEHLWASLRQFTGEDRFEAELCDTPYYTDRLKKGDTCVCHTAQITDWQIHFPQKRITPDEAYIIPDLLSGNAD